MVGKHLLLTQAQDIFKFLFYDIKYSNTPSLKKMLLHIKLEGG